MWPFKKDTPDFFSAEEVASINASMAYTPDMYMLQMYKKWLYFAYSADQDGHPKSVADLGAEKTHIAWTSGQYSMYRKQLGGESFAIALDDPYDQAQRAEKHHWGYENGPASAQSIKGELFLVTPEMLVSLDERVENTVQFNRRRVSVSVPYRFQYRDKDGNLKVSGRQSELRVAWMYIGNPEFWDKQIDNGFLFKPAKLFTPELDELRRYYHFDKLGYDE